jgi:hypothetical protein
MTHASRRRSALTTKKEVVAKEVQTLLNRNRVTRHGAHLRKGGLDDRALDSAGWP